MSTENPSFTLGQNEIEFFSKDDPTNERGTNRLSFASRRFKRTGMLDLVNHHLDSGDPKSFLFLLRDRSTYLSVARTEFLKARAATPRARSEFIESIMSVASNSIAVCLEEGVPGETSNNSSSPHDLQTPGEGH